MNHTFEVHLPKIGRAGRVLIDGEELHSVREIVIRSRADGLTEITLTLIPEMVVAFGEAERIRVLMQPIDPAPDCRHLRTQSLGTLGHEARPAPVMCRDCGETFDGALYAAQS